MKKLLIAVTVLVFPLFVFAYTSPGKAQGFVSDFANILDSSTKQKIETDLQNLNNTKTVEVAVVTVPDLGDENIESYAVKLFEEWGIGKKNVDNGILLLVAPKEREVRIEVGYGMESVVTDLLSNQIIQKVIIPEFKTGNYGFGITKGVDALSQVINNTGDTSFVADQNNFSFNGKYFEFFIFIFFLFISIASHILGKSKSWWMGGIVGAGIGLIMSIFVGFIYFGLVAVIVLTLLGLLFDFIVSKGGPRAGGFWGGGGFGGGHGSGGFGGFGGGFSGGGGASGRW
jgi:uncharacterized protein